MKDLIERQAAIDAVCLEGCGMCAEAIKDIPAAKADEDEDDKRRKTPVFHCGPRR
ncbi:MAG: hypothetical protein IKF59_04415 [Lachnospiraceae bacterium]|nr:hypothetical protein [Eubacterium sp.]MBR3187266.1 hypothetical protein [Lachnospiraceae bacterium]